MFRSLPKHVKVQFWLLLAIPVDLLLLLLAALFPQTTEIYCRVVRPVFMEPLSRLTGLLPFSLAEVLILSTVLCVIFLFVLAVVIIVRAKGSVTLKLVDWVTRLLAVVFCVMLLFNLLYGFCYYRQNTAFGACRYHLAYSTEDISHVALYMTTDLNEARKKTGLAENEPYSFRLTPAELSDACREAYGALVADFPIYGGDYGNPKPVALSVPWTYTYVMGMYFPFTGEANYNTNIPSVELPHTILHEMAHQRGIAAEDEANFAAFLAGEYASDPRVKYSALFESWLYVMNTLKRADTEAYEAVLSRACAGVKADMQHADAFWESYDTPLASFSDDVNRLYLESNGVKFGTASYSLSVQYILDYYVNTYLMDYIVLNE